MDISYDLSFFFNVNLPSSIVGAFYVCHDTIQRLEAWPKMDEKEAPYDLIVVGAGIGGLCAAKTYLELAPESNVIILEAVGQANDKGEFNG